MVEKKDDYGLSPEITKLSEKLLKDPASKLFFPLAEEYIKSGMLEEAIMVLKDGLRIHPGFYAARVSLGKVYLQKGKIAEAKAEFERVTAKHPDNLMAQKKLALIYRDEGSVEKAKQICKEILLSNSKDVEMRTLLAELEKREAERIPEGISQVTAGEPSPSAPPQAEQSGQPTGAPPEPAHQAEAAGLSETSPEPAEEGQMLPGPGPAASGMGAEAAESSPAAPAGSESELGGGPDQAAHFAKDQSEKEAAGAEGRSLPEPRAPLGPAGDRSGPEQDGPGTKTPPGSREDEHLLKEFGSDRRKESLEEEVFSELLGASSNLRLTTDQAAGPAQTVGLTSQSIAELYIKQGHYEQGIEIYRKLLEQDPENAEIRHGLENAMALANLLTKRPRESKQPKAMETEAENRREPAKSSPEPYSPRHSPDDIRQAKIQRLQAWLDQLKRARNP